MKKYIYFCGMMLLCMNMMAQIDLNDPNWERVFYDDFTTNRSWRSSDWYSIPDLDWRARPKNHITHGDEHQIYQFDHCLFDLNECGVKLVSEFDATNRIPTHQYALPNGFSYPTETDLYYFSGEMDIVSTTFKYGYFEIRCKLPVHQGAFPAFWLYSSSDTVGNSYYEEIDIFEYSWSNGDPNAFWLHPNNPNPTYAGDPHIITCGIYHNLIGESPNYQHPDSYGRVYPGNLPDVSADFHVYGCEWMPDHVYWYFDGQLINAYTDVTHIPRHPLTLKTNYAINNYAGDKINDVWQPVWFGTGIMTIDYINVYQLPWDCQTDEIIASQSDLEDFEYAVKRKIYITSTNNEPIVSNTDHVTFRVTDSFEITGVFEVQQGAEFTVIMQECPNDDNE